MGDRRALRNVNVFVVAILASALLPQDMSGCEFCATVIGWLLVAVSVSAPSQHTAMEGRCHCEILDPAHLDASGSGRYDEAQISKGSVLQRGGFVRRKASNGHLIQMASISVADWYFGTGTTTGRSVSPPLSRNNGTVWPWTAQRRPRRR